MKPKDNNDLIIKHILSSQSRRNFLSKMSLAATGIFFSRYVLAGNLLKIPGEIFTGRNNKVAVTQANNYESTFIRQKVEHLFDSLGGISDVVQSGDKVGIKINLTGGSGYADHPNLYGVDIRECAWTHPEVLRAVGELLIDAGVNGNDIYFLEALWDSASYDQFGYSDVQNYLGAQVVNLNGPAPYPSFITKSTGSDYFYYPSFLLNQVLDEIDVFVSIPKMKQHYTAGVTHSMKNLIGIAPLDAKKKVLKPYGREWLHAEGGEEAWYHLPRSICDLNMARPIHLAVIDGIKNAVGGEGPWNPTFMPHEDDYLLAGKNPVSTDSIASLIMGNDPASEQFLRPDGTYCDNYLWLACQKGMGTNLPDEIELVGDGAGTIGIDEDLGNEPLNSSSCLHQNYPNPFKSFTTIRYSLFEQGLVFLTVYDLNGQEADRLVNEMKSTGNYQIEWNGSAFPPGTYLLKLEFNGKSTVKKMKLVQ
mgnify:CR=1 FL=1